MVLKRAPRDPFLLAANLLYAVDHLQYKVTIHTLAKSLQVQWIWKQNAGHSARETDAAYRLFVEFLLLGPDRKLRPFAVQRGLVPPNVYDRAKRYNWFERAAAYDTWTAAGRPPESLPPEELPTKPEEKEEQVKRLSVTQEVIKQAAKKVAPFAPSEVLQQDTALEPEVLGAAVEKAAHDQNTKALLEYRQVMHAIGRSMGLRAVAIDALVGTMQGNIERSMESHQVALATQEWAVASAQMQTVTTMVVSFTKLCDAMRTQAEAARACWGDALGVNQMLKQMYQQMQKLDSNGSD